MQSSNSVNEMKFDDNLILCIRQGDNEKAQKILEKVDPSDIVDSSGTTLLHIAVDCENEVMTKYLIEKGCKVDAVDNLGNTPLILASRTKHARVISVLLATDASVLITNQQGESAAKIILGNIAKPSISYNDRRALLHKAYTNNKEKIAAQLELSNIEKTSLHYNDILALLKKVKEECLNDSLLTAEKLIEAHCPLNQALELKDTVITKYFLDNGCDVNERCECSGMAPLHVAVMKDDLENVKLLISRGADVNIEDLSTCKVRPLFFINNKNIAEVLLDNGAKLVTDNGDFVGRGSFLCRQTDKKLTKMLVQRFPNFSARDIIGRSFLNILASSDMLDVVEILKDNMNDTFDVNQRCSNGVTVLIDATCRGNYKLIEFLLMKGADVNIRTDNGHAAIMSLIRCSRMKPDQKDRIKILKLFLKYGADIQLVDSNQLTILDKILQVKNFEMMRIILARLALMDVLGYEIKDLIRAKIDSNLMFKNYFDYCKRKVEYLKQNTMKSSMYSLKYDNYKLTDLLWRKLMIVLSMTNCKL